MFGEYSNIQNVVVNESYHLCDEVIDLLNVILIVIIAISLLLIIFVFPIYYFTQQQREEILKLNSTYDPQKLDPLIQTLNKIILKENILRQKIIKKINLSSQHNTLNAKKIQQQQKKKILSSTSSLSKINPYLIIVSLTIFTLMSIYLLINLIVLTQFVKEGKYNIDEINSLYSVRAQLTSNYAANYMAMSGSLVEGQLDETKYQRVMSLAGTNENKLQSILDIFNDFSSTRHNKDLYQEFFLKILKDNICDAFSNYPELINATYFISDTECREISNHILEKGLYMTLKYIFYTFEKVLAYYDKTSVDEFIQNLQLWVSQFDFLNSINQVCY